LMGIIMIHTQKAKMLTSTLSISQQKASFQLEQLK
jgi:hypothetical protein